MWCKLIVWIIIWEILLHFICDVLLRANDAGQQAASRVCGTRNCPADDFYRVEYRLPLGRITFADLWRSIQAHVTATLSTSVVNTFGCHVAIVFHIPTVWTLLFGRKHDSSIAIHIAKGTRCWFHQNRNTAGVTVIQQDSMSTCIFGASNATIPVGCASIDETIQLWIFRQTQEVNTCTFRG